jgi:3-oxoacyl-[acyl-carrier protein] reductase
MKLKDRVAIVTGAGSGIGQATALLFAREGARVGVLDLDPDAARGTTQQIEKAEAIGKTVTAWGRLDIFYANAGVPQWPGAVEEVDESVFDRIMAVNVKGVFLGAKHAVPVMKKQKSGVFLITGSTAALKPRPGGQCYAASKGAVTTMTQSLALELAPFGIRVVVIAPVATETPMLPTFMGKKEVDEEGMQRYVATVPLGRLNQPEDIAKAALFLASDDAAMITGSCFLVDGGRCA